MLSIVDKKMPGKAKEALSKYSDILELETDLAYKTISGHPDIFFCKAGKSLIAAPNLQVKYLNILKNKNINYKTGADPVGEEYPQTAAYCAVISGDILVHRIDVTDPVILDEAYIKEKINVNQAYTRCSLLPLLNNNFITSDQGIYKNLINGGYEILLADPGDIVLPGFNHGFFGGACGIHDKTVFLAGCLDYFRDGQIVREFILSLKYDIVELYDGPLYDCGSILIVE